MSKVEKEYERRLALAMDLVEAARVSPRAVAEVAIASLAAAQVPEKDFKAGVESLLLGAIRLQEEWKAAEEAACNCTACKLDRAAKGGPVVIEEATADEAERLLAQYGEGS
jgi:hypothetical protein